MWIANIFILCLLVTSRTSAENENESKVEVEITIVEKPEDCIVCAKHGDTLSVHYVGKLSEGKQFVSSYDRDDPYTFQLGIANVIQGWDVGVQDMCVGEKRHLSIPPELAYGDKGSNIIPPGATLEFDVELVDISGGPLPEQIFADIDHDGNAEFNQIELKRWLLVGRRYDDSGITSPRSDSDYNKEVREAFKQLDADKNRKVTLDEFLVYKEYFLKLNQRFVASNEAQEERFRKQEEAERRRNEQEEWEAECSLDDDDKDEL